MYYNEELVTNLKFQTQFSRESAWKYTIHEQGGGQTTSRLYGVDQKKVGTHLKKCYIAFMFWVTVDSPYSDTPFNSISDPCIAFLMHPCVVVWRENKD